MPDSPTPAKAPADRIDRTLKAIRDHETAPSMQLSMKDGALNIAYECDDLQAAMLLQMADMGTADRDVYAGLTGQIACLGAHGLSVDSTASNFVLGVVRCVKPRDELEALLATQMGAIHAASMMMARKLNLVTTIPQQDSAERALNKLTRTFAMQMDTLKRYRTGGHQKVTVEHVTVQAGGQAIVGAVQTGAGGRG